MGHTALYFATSSGNPDMVKVLKTAGDTALNSATTRGHPHEGTLCC